mmetsp:Transcript_63671/g.150784  ORF Transcript_63671/g.150784 Transcript_63671/m.150784 type:complete len:117 (+) Transcript_63671:358-708(+)
MSRPISCETSLRWKISTPSLDPTPSLSNFSNFGVVIAKKMKKSWQVASQSYPPGSGVTFVDVDCGQHAAVCQQYGANAYPKILLFVEGKQQEHQGSREAKDLVTWVSERHPFVKAE